MRWECRERFPRHRGFAIPTCITARSSRTYCDARRDRYLVIFFEVGGEENVLDIPGARATRNFTYMVRGPFHGLQLASTHNDGILVYMLITQCILRPLTVGTYCWYSCYAGRDKVFRYAWARHPSRMTYAWSAEHIISWKTRRTAACISRYSWAIVLQR